MSTAKIREALGLLREMLEHPNITADEWAIESAARAELEAIERAATALLEKPERGKMSSKGGPDAWRLLTTIRDEAASRKGTS